MTKPYLDQTLGALIQVMVCVVFLGAFAAAHGAEREICDKMTGEQLRRCIEDTARAQPAPTNTGTPPRTSGTPTTGGAIILPPTLGTAAVSAAPTKLQILNCTKVSYPDQSFCAYRNSALLECANRAKYPDPDRCFNETMSRSPDITAVDCSKLPDAHQASCRQRNTVYASCKNDKMNYLACLEGKMAKQK